MDVARLIGTRRGQLSRTERSWIDPERRVLAWPPDECKNDAPHVIPIDEAAWAIIEQLLQQGAERPWCPYLFDGLRPGAQRVEALGLHRGFPKLVGDRVPEGWTPHRTQGGWVCLPPYAEHGGDRSARQRQALGGGGDGDLRAQDGEHGEALQHGEPGGAAGAAGGGAARDGADASAHRCAPRGEASGAGPWLRDDGRSSGRSSGMHLECM